MLVSDIDGELFGVVFFQVCGRGGGTNGHGLGTRRQIPISVVRGDGVRVRVSEG